MKKLVFLKGLIVFSLLAFFVPNPAHTATTAIRVPVSMDFKCWNDGSGYLNPYGYSCSVAWPPVPGASRYYVKSHTWANDEVIYPPAHERGLGGGGGAFNCQDPRTDCWNEQPFFDVYALFPDSAGNLKIEKIRTGAQQGYVVPGQQISFQLKYTNVGTGPIDRAIITDSIPAYLTYVSGGYPQKDGTVQWVVNNIAPGQTGSVGLVLKVVKDIPPTTTNIYNMVVSAPPADKPKPPAGSDPTGFSSPVGFAVSRCDYLVSQGSSGNATWLDTTVSTTYQPLQMLDEIKDNDIVRVAGGYASFKHTVATGQLLVSRGGFVMTTCEDLTDSPHVLSRIGLTPNTSLHHSVSGIMNPDELVEVKGRYLTLQVHEGTYTYEGSSLEEIVTVEKGKVVVIDRLRNRHVLTDGQTFSSPQKVSMPGPQLSETNPQDKSSINWESFSVTYTFDQPVVSVGPGSRFGISKNYSSQGFSGTLSDLVAGNAISLAWNPKGDALTITLSQNAGIDATEEALFLSLHLEDVAGMSHATPVIDKALTLYLVRAATGARAGVNLDRFYYSTDVPVSNTMTLQMLDDLPGPPPTGLYQVSPTYHFTTTYDYTGTVSPQVYLGGATHAFLPATTTGVGIYRWGGSKWDMVCEGCTSGFDGRGKGYPIYWFGAVNNNAILDKDFTVVLFSRMLDPAPPEIASIGPAVTPALPTTPLVIKVNAPLGLDQGLTEVIVNGVQQYSYDPGTDTVPNWTITESNGVTTLTFANHASWPNGKLVTGRVHVYGRYGALSTSAAFSFLVP